MDDMKDLSSKVREISYAIHVFHGNGYLENVYENALVNPPRTSIRLSLCVLCVPCGELLPCERLQKITSIEGLSHKIPRINVCRKSAHARRAQSRLLGEL